MLTGRQGEGLLKEIVYCDNGVYIGIMSATNNTEICLTTIHPWEAGMHPVCPWIPGDLITPMAEVNLVYECQLPAVVPGRPVHPLLCSVCSPFLWLSDVSHGSWWHTNVPGLYSFSPTVLTCSARSS